MSQNQRDGILRKIQPTFARFEDGKGPRTKECRQSSEAGQEIK